MLPEGLLADIGAFVAIGNNGWLISTIAPRSRTTVGLDRQIVQKAEPYGIEPALSMIKLRGFSDKSGLWDQDLEAFTDSP